MKIYWINQHKQIQISSIPNDLDYLTIHQEWHVEREYLAFYIIILGWGVEIVLSNKND